MKKERLFSNDVKIDQMPGHESVHTMEAEFSMNDHVEELSKRVLNRADSLSQGDGVMIANFYGDKEGLNKKIESILKYGIKGAKTETDKINKSLDIIESITNALNGEC
jgi:hypothetical protein